MRKRKRNTRKSKHVDNRFAFEACSKGSRSTCDFIFSVHFKGFKDKLILACFHSLLSALKWSSLWINHCSSDTVLRPISCFALNRLKPLNAARPVPTRQQNERNSQVPLQERIQHFLKAMLPWVGNNPDSGHVIEFQVTTWQPNLLL